MSQKLISSFFKTKQSEPKKDDIEHPEKKSPVKSNGRVQKTCKTEDSPVKAASKKKIKRIIESDEEEMEVEPSVESPEKTSPIGKRSGSKKSKNTIESDEEEMEIQQSKKESPQKVSPEKETKTSPEVSPQKAESPQQDVNASPVMRNGIPKRKTARKSLKRKSDANPDGEVSISSLQERILKKMKESPPEDSSASSKYKMVENEKDCLPAADEVKNESDDDSGSADMDSSITSEKATSPDKTKEKKPPTEKTPSSKKPRGRPKKSPESTTKKESKGKKGNAKQQTRLKEEKLDEEFSETDAAESEIKKESKTSKVHSFFAPKKAKEIVDKELDSSNKDEKSSKSPESSKPKMSLFGSSSDGPQSNEAAYDPSKSNYHPIDNACWKRGEKIPYLAFARTLEKIEEISGRIKMIQVMRNFFRSIIVLSPDDLVYAVYLCLNKIAADYKGEELGIGETLLMKALGQATGRTLDKIKADVAVKGDLGLVAEASRSNQRMMFAPPKLTLVGVFARLKDVAQMSGNAAQTKKIDIIKGMFVACRHSEARYLIRSLTGKLRIGLAENSVLTALAHAAVLTPPGQSYPPEIIDASEKMSSDTLKKKLEDATLLLKTTYCECPDYDVIIPVLLKEGIEKLPEHCKLTPGVPLKPMLAHPTKEVSNIFQKFENSKFTCEYKYDGERAQIHVVEGGKVHIYSRNQEDNTSKYPDVISRIPKVLNEGVKNCIIDSEAVAWDKETKQILPFQILSTRKKKDANMEEIKVQVCIFAFDLLYYNDEPLVKKSFRERRELLRSIINEVEGEFMLAKSADADSIEQIQEFLDESIKGKCEGLMVKTLDSDASYEIAKRSHNWLKLKKDYLEGVGDTLDVVVIGGYHGKGKRTGNYGGFLLACYDPENEEFQSLCKIGTGLKEDELEKHSTFFKQHVIDKAKSYYRYDSSLEPDEWFDAVQVWEIKCADLSISPVHKAAMGLVDPEKGISLRFPRFLRIRDDKNPEDATSASQIAQMYNNQEQVKNQKDGNAAQDEEDFY